VARPSKYSKIIAEEILSRYADGETLSKICKDKSMPKRNTVYRWRQSYPEFGEAYLLAQEEHVDALVDEAGEIVDTELNPQRAKVRADQRKWLASRLNRQKYGDKLDVQHNHTLDIGPALALAVKRMKSIGVGTPEMKLIEAENSD
jgi:transposase-like protein